jgi:hypothetical protein
MAIPFFSLIAKIKRAWSHWVLNDVSHRRHAAFGLSVTPSIAEKGTKLLRECAKMFAESLLVVGAIAEER